MACSSPLNVCREIAGPKISSTYTSKVIGVQEDCRSDKRAFIALSLAISQDLFSFSPFMKLITLSNCFLSAKRPNSVSSRFGPPICLSAFSDAVLIALMNCGAIPSWSRTRLAAKQICREFLKNDLELCSTAFSRLASSNMRAGDLPPSSKETCFRLDLDAAGMTLRPATAEPVNAIM